MESGLLCDDQGLGKTIEILALILANAPATLSKRMRGKKLKGGEKHGVTLVVCPASVLIQWHDELCQHTAPGTLKILKWHGPKKTRDIKRILKYDVVLTTFATLGQVIIV